MTSSLKKKKEKSNISASTPTASSATPVNLHLLKHHVKVY
jgi:hypothetical protein